MELKDNYLNTRYKKEIFKPIITCIVDSNRQDQNEEQSIINIKKEMFYNATHIDIGGTEKYLKENNIIRKDYFYYAISACDEKSKDTDGLYPCTGIVVVGEDKNTGKQISIMTHQNPSYFLHRYKDDFTKDLILRLKEVKERSKKGSIDVLIFGGRITHKNEKEKEEYKESVQFLTSVIKDELNIKPDIITGPNLRSLSNDTKIYFDTQNRRLYILRPGAKQKENEHYKIEDFDKQSKKWYEKKDKK